MMKHSAPLIKTQHDKALLHQCITLALESQHQIASAAAQQAYETATNGETKAENKYDTFGLEASYLAHGQSKRVDEYANNIEIFKQLPINLFKPHDAITLGCLVLLLNEQDEEQYYYLSPVAGGLKIEFNRQTITLITPSAPLGKALVNQQVEADIKFTSHSPQCFNILAIH